ncbi:hypothetical protein O6H91_Y413900 [Diphasiastrum complanatum]|nr:hypothetical protein O6H91_Y413900 [Diphasiastrum complanatum]KAJ7256887.1 hypothetical protein O6H91_Y413900 [Diphasiastrum complanatum]
MAHSPMSIFANHAIFVSKFDRIIPSGFSSNGKTAVSLIPQHGRVCRPSTFNAARLESKVQTADSQKSVAASQLDFVSLLGCRAEATIEARSNGSTEANTNYPLVHDAQNLEIIGSNPGVINEPDCAHLSPKEITLACAFLGLGTSYFINVDWAEAAHLHSKVPLRSVLPELALGNGGGPLLEEFWDNMRRYGLYFITVATGGIYSLVKPLADLLKSPVTAVLLVVVLSGSFYLLYLTLSTMLGIIDFDYEYSP